MNPELIPEPFPPAPVFYPVQEVYPTIQGEGVWTGCPAVFVRLMGCGVGCSWCDTKHTWTIDHANALAELPEGPRGLVPTFVMMTADQVVRRVKLYAPVAHVVLTGGEPAEHDLAELAEALYQADLMAQIETSGTMPLGLAINSLWWVTVSPKVGMPGGREVLAETVAQANEIKWPVGKQADLDRLHAFLKLHQPDPEITICVQPLSQSAKATELCVQACLRHGWRLSLQTHKSVGLP